jgi:hypothetical protein
VGWETRGDCGPYYYRSVREGDRVRKVYGGGGVMGKLIAQVDEMRRRKQEDEAEHWREERKHLEQSAAFVRELEEAAKILARAELLALGCYKRRGEWRRRRECA